MRRKIRKRPLLTKDGRSNRWTKLTADEIVAKSVRLGPPTPFYSDFSEWRKQTLKWKRLARLILPGDSSMSELRAPYEDKCPRRGLLEFRKRFVILSKVQKTCRDRLYLCPKCLDYLNLRFSPKGCERLKCLQET